MALCKDAGAKRAMRLNVSGAFHSPLMESAADGLAEALDAASFDDPHFPVYANVNGAAGHERGRARSAACCEQLSKPGALDRRDRERSPTRFPDALFVEMGPGTVLGGSRQEDRAEREDRDVRHRRRSRAASASSWSR